MNAALSARLRSRYGPWAVVTGASDGIGRAFAAQLAAAGLHLLLVARRQEALEALAAELAARRDVQTRVLSADLARPDGVWALEAASADLDVGLLVAAAGFGTSGDFARADLETELNLLALNGRAVLLLSHHFARRFVARRRGGLVLLSSLLAFQGVPGAAHYAATKAYVQTLAEGLHRELAPLGVDVLASAPGPVHTGFADRADLRMGLGLRPDTVALASLQTLGRRVTVRPGWLSLLLEAALAPLPRSARSGVMARVMGGMTRHQTGG